MSFYRKLSGEPSSKAPQAAAPKQPEKSGVAQIPAADREQAERAKRSKGEPANIPLPMTRAWFERLPADVRPHELLRSFGRIANLLAASWNEPEATNRYFDHLLVDRRGSRKGFPTEVMREIFALRAHYVQQHPPTFSAWGDTRKR
jgi:hypothetical protein